jgi:hypothetical protein
MGDFLRTKYTPSLLPFERLSSKRNSEPSQIEFDEDFWNILKDAIKRLTALEPQGIERVELLVGAWKVGVDLS